MKKRHASLAIVVVLTMTAMIAGCSTSPATPTEPPAPEPSPSETFMGRPGVMQEYQSAMSNYPLPAGVSYPKDPFAGQSGTFQEGYGEEEAVSVWNCAWAKEYLRLQGTDAAGASAALEKYASIQDTEVYKKYYDPQSTQLFITQWIASARLGDPSGVQQNVSANCGG